MSYQNPYDKYLPHVVIFIVLCFLIFIGLKVWAKNHLCHTYYSEMNTVACFLNNSTLPQRTNR